MDEVMNKSIKRAIMDTSGKIHIEYNPEPIVSEVAKLSKFLTDHIEKFACAFAKETGLDPTKIKMVQQEQRTGGGFGYKVWFEPFPSDSEIEMYRAGQERALAELAKAEARVKVCQKGYNFADKLPETGERVLFKNWNGHFMLLTFEVNLSGNCLFHDDSDKHHSYDIADTRFEYFWYPLPVTSEDND